MSVQPFLRSGLVWPREGDAGIWLARARGLRRFWKAQDEYGVDRVVDELVQGRKTGHWIWFVFPQDPHPLATSRNSRVYALDEREARKFAKHPVLGTRLRFCVDLVFNARCKGASLESILGADAAKFRSSMALFARATGDPTFRAPIGESW